MGRAVDLVARFARWLARAWHVSLGSEVCKCGAYLPSTANPVLRGWRPVEPRGDAEPYWLCVGCLKVRIVAWEMRRRHSGRARV